MSGLGLFGTMDYEENVLSNSIVSPNKRRNIDTTAPIHRPSTASMLSGLTVKSHSTNTSPSIHPSIHNCVPQLLNLNSNLSLCPTTVSSSSSSSVQHSPLHNARRLSISTTTSSNNTQQQSPRINTTPLHTRKSLTLHSIAGSARLTSRSGSATRSAISMRSDISRTVPTAELQYALKNNTNLISNNSNGYNTDTDTDPHHNKLQYTPPKALKTMSVLSACNTPQYQKSPQSSPSRPPLSRSRTPNISLHHSSPIPDLNVLTTKLSAPSPARKRYTTPNTPTPKRQRNSTNDFTFDDKLDGILYVNNLLYDNTQPINITLSDFSCIERIGCGSYAEVWLAEPKHSNIIKREYAIKKNSNSYDTNNERDHGIKHIKLYERLTAQYNTLSPHILQHYCMWQQSGKLNTCTELCSSDCSELNPINVREQQCMNDSNAMNDIDDIRKDDECSQLSECEIWRFLQHTSTGLHQLHSCNIIHCDIKPENIFRTSDNIYKLGDLASMTDCNDINNVIDNADGKCLAPEAFNPNISFGTYSDIFSLGVTLYIIITGGRVPIRPDYSTIYIDFAHVIVQCSNILIQTVQSMCSIDIHNRPTAQQLTQLSIQQYNLHQSYSSTLLATPNRKTTVQDPIHQLDQKFGSGSSNTTQSSIANNLTVDHTMDVTELIHSNTSTPAGSPRGTTKRTIKF